MPPTVLVVDDEVQIRKGLRNLLQPKGYRVLEGETGRAAMEMYRSEAPDAAILDYRLDDCDGLHLYERLRNINDSVPAIILTGHPSAELAAQFIQRGVEYFLAKPVEAPILLALLQRCLENPVRVWHRARFHLDPFLGTSKAIRDLREQVTQVAKTDATILIQGETGTGKGVLARWIHAVSHRCKGRFVDLNCAGLNEQLIDSELFGHSLGAFTGAVRRKVGLFEEANQGTVFLDARKCRIVVPYRQKDVPLAPLRHAKQTQVY